MYKLSSNNTTTYKIVGGKPFTTLNSCQFYTWALMQLQSRANWKNLFWEDTSFRYAADLISS